MAIAFSAMLMLAASVAVAGWDRPLSSRVADLKAATVRAVRVAGRVMSLQRLRASLRNRAASRRFWTEMGYSAAELRAARGAVRKLEHKLISSRTAWPRAASTRRIKAVVRREDGTGHLFLFDGTEIVMRGLSAEQHTWVEDRLLRSVWVSQVFAEQAALAMACGTETARLEGIVAIRRAAAGS